MFYLLDFRIITVSCSFLSLLILFECVFACVCGYTRADNFCARMSVLSKMEKARRMYNGDFCSRHLSNNQRVSAQFPVWLYWLHAVIPATTQTGSAAPLHDGQMDRKIKNTSRECADTLPNLFQALKIHTHTHTKDALLPALCHQCVRQSYSCCVLFWIPFSSFQKSNIINYVLWVHDVKKANSVCPSPSTQCIQCLSSSTPLRANLNLQERRLTLECISFILSSSNEKLSLIIELTVLSVEEGVLPGQQRYHSADSLSQFRCYNLVLDRIG